MDTDSDARVIRPGDSDHPKAQVAAAGEPENGDVEDTEAPGRRTGASYLIRVNLPADGPTIATMEAIVKDALGDLDASVSAERLDR